MGEKSDNYYGFENANPEFTIGLAHVLAIGEKSDNYYGFENANPEYTLG